MNKRLRSWNWSSLQLCFIIKYTALRLAKKFHRIVSASQSSNLKSSDHLLAPIFFYLTSTILSFFVSCSFPVALNQTNQTLIIIIFWTARNCAEVFKGGQRISGVYTIYPDDKAPFDVYCEQTTAGWGWTVIQLRLNGFVDFNHTWDDYKRGFGNFLIGKYWLELEKIRREIS